MNTNSFNSAVYNQTILPSSTTQGDFVFNGYELKSDITKVRIKNSNHDNPWKVEYNKFDNANLDGGWVLSRFFRERQITFEIAINATDVAELNSKIDEFKKNVRAVEWSLDIKVTTKEDGVDVTRIRRVKATMTNLDFSREFYHISFVPNVSITFTAVNPHSYLIDYVSWLETWVTTDSTIDISNQWTIETELFSWVYFVSASWVTACSITVDWYTVTATDTFTTWDIIIFDWETATVTKNWIEIDYDWVFRQITTDTNIVTYSFTGWTYDAEVSYKFLQKYL